MTVTEEAADQAGQRSIAAWYLSIEPRHAGMFGIALWIAAVATLVLYTHGAPLGILGFTLIECWLIGTGCLGVPILAARLFGCTLTPGRCLTAAIALAALAIMLTALIAGGQIHAAPITAAFGLIIPEALAIHMANAYDSLTRQEAAVTAARREERADYARDVRAAFTAGIRAAHKTMTAQDEQIDELLGSDTEQIARLSDAFLTELDARRAARFGRSRSVPLRLVTDPTWTFPAANGGTD
jgi:hypothetical protein